MFVVPYPFSRDTWREHDSDLEGVGGIEVPTWKPGPHYENRETAWSRRGEEAPDVVSVADGMGAQVITVVGVYRPGRFPTRVFYTRQWRDPDGKLFGKSGCHSLTVAPFSALVGGYRHPFELAANVNAGATPPEARTSESAQDSSPTISQGRIAG